MVNLKFLILKYQNKYHRDKDIIQYIKITTNVLPENFEIVVDEAPNANKLPDVGMMRENLRNRGNVRNMIMEEDAKDGARNHYELRSFDNVSDDNDVLQLNENRRFRKAKIEEKEDEEVVRENKQNYDQQINLNPERKPEDDIEDETREKFDPLVKVINENNGEENKDEAEKDKKQEDENKEVMMNNFAEGDEEKKERKRVEIHEPLPGIAEGTIESVDSYIDPESYKISCCRYFIMNLLMRHIYLSPFAFRCYLNPRYKKITSLSMLLFLNLLFNSIIYSVDSRVVLGNNPSTDVLVSVIFYSIATCMMANLFITLLIVPIKLLEPVDASNIAIGNIIYPEK